MISNVIEKQGSFFVGNILSYSKSTNKRYYFQDSEFYQIRGGFEAELIRNPMIKFIEHGIVERAVYELQSVTMKAFEKPMDDVDVYAPMDVIKKNAIFSDWLTVIRKDGMIVAYGSQSYLAQDVLYLNSAMVDPKYQGSGAFGILIQLYVWDKIIRQRYFGHEQDLKIIIRTRNKNGASVMHHVLDEVDISGDSNISLETKRLYTDVASILESTYDVNTGIAPNVYPAGLPTGTNGKYKKVNELFSGLCDRDAYFVSGIVNMRATERIINREVVDTTRKTELNIQCEKKVVSLAA
ncbi:hypothetical protein K8S19_11910 [bacterium]|nr:hypothetical protein [bacterium]